MKIQLVHRINNVLSRIISTLEAIGKIINETPTAQEKKDIKSSPIQNQPLWKKKNDSLKPKKIRVAKEVYGHKGSGYKGKGNINTDAATFNHPRKDVSHGRNH